MIKWLTFLSLDGEDFTGLPFNTSILFQPGDALSEACTNISISDDDIIEGNEDLTVTIDDFGNSRIRINNNVTVVNIIDNDRKLLLFVFRFQPIIIIVVIKK